ncbi:NADH dehydrogenase [ubiquinone] 1 alpha subcomplex subunit 12 isoform 2-T2 [Trichechus inunguis]|uniref:NADH dehydrogenase [ubiquinone] 1 alpha subcomplex subunit 12 n=1 Tax=Trichechus manatus latirostris TaxID=127582 RepID=A0A2Y9RDA8_TRIMA|nr:NADH dehydrogenase [ubiquinone] 1 alpha subcomplex subunit 12 isoform X2 [Trichechus manatus latirostris]
MEYLQVVKRGLQQISGHGGLRGYLRVLFRTNDVRVGTLVGEDKYGNKYYEDNKQFFGRHRWVIYTTEMNGKNTFWDVDGSMVPPEWTVTRRARENIQDGSHSLFKSHLGSDIPYFCF